MRKLAITFAVTAAVLGEATTRTAAARIGATAKDYSPVKKAACVGYGRRYPPGVPLGVRVGTMLVLPLLN
jgi:hypothetical protein